MIDISKDIELNSDFLRAINNKKKTFRHNGDVFYIPDIFLTDGLVRKIVQGTKRDDSDELYFVINNDKSFVALTAKEYITLSHDYYLSELKKYKGNASSSDLARNLEMLYSYALKTRKYKGKVYNHQLVVNNPFFCFDRALDDQEINEISKKLSEGVINFFTSSNSLDSKENTDNGNSRETVVLDKSKLLDMISDGSGFAVFRDASDKTHLYAYDENVFDRLFFEKSMEGRVIPNSRLVPGYYVNMVEMYKKLLRYGGKDLMAVNSDDSAFRIEPFMEKFYKTCLEKNMAINFGVPSKAESFAEINDSYTGKRASFEGVKLKKGLYVNKAFLERVFEEYAFIGYGEQASVKINK